MNLDDLKDRLRTDLQKTKERLEENSAFVALRDRFRSQSAAVQRLILAAVGAVVLLIVLSVPYGHVETSKENIASFEAKRSLLRDLLHVQKEVNETPEIALPPPIESVKSRIDSDLQAAQLLPEQIKAVNVLPPAKTDLVNPQQNEGVVEVNLGQLNLKQVVDLGYGFQTISSSVKMKDLVIQASPGAKGYFDVIYRLLVLKVTPEEVPAAKEPPKKKGRR